MPGRSSTSNVAQGVLTSLEPRIDVPLALLADVMPAVTSIEELQVLIAIVRLIPERGDYATPLADRTILRDPRLRAALRTEGSPREPDRRIATGLELSVARGTLLRFEIGKGRRAETWYFVRTPENKTTLDLMERGTIAPPTILWPDEHAPSIRVERPNAFRLYEQNIGPLTPLIADQITRAIEAYPDDWIADAMGEAVAYNRRNWRYILKILESWKAQGRRPQEA